MPSMQSNGFVSCSFYSGTLRTSRTKSAICVPHDRRKVPTGSSMKTVTSAQSSKDDDHVVHNADRSVDVLKFDEIERAETRDERCRSAMFHVGSRVERELDGLWFSGTITDAEPESDCYEIEYDEDTNREGEVSASELRLLDPSRTQEVAAKKEMTGRQQETLRRDSLLMQTSDYDPRKEPTVILHHQGDTNAAAGYIINGLENNVATGNGLRGIRWLRGNSF